MKDKVLFIGASGFVGTRLIEITQSDFEVTNLDKQQSYFYPDITVLGDVRHQEQLDQALAGFSTVVLLAAEHRDDVSPTSLYYDVNVQGTRNVLAAMEKNGVKNIIFTSSVAVYGLNKVNPDETHPHDPFNHYGKSKWQAEEVLREWFNKAPQENSLTIIRPTVILANVTVAMFTICLSRLQAGNLRWLGRVLILNQWLTWVISSISSSLG
ncbi:UDP-glucose 4-epimerase [Lelliottia amnigena]|nr:UDP-glucose 4-epimerase [Lelliottia amnigena]